MDLCTIAAVSGWALISMLVLGGVIKKGFMDNRITLVPRGEDKLDLNFWPLVMSCALVAAGVAAGWVVFGM